MSRVAVVGIALLRLQPCLAMPWLGPMETPMGLMATAGISPIPTEAPGLSGIPKELKPRQNALIYPPPNNWCGLVEGLTDDILSCSASLSCVSSNYAIGCCPATDGLCTALYTTCYDYTQLSLCNNECENDVSIQKCSGSLYPYCGTYSFAGGNYLYNCQPTSMFLESSVEYLADYYLTAIGSTLAPTSDSFQSDRATASATASATKPVHPFSTTSTSDDDTSTGLAAAAIGGIAAGAGLVICCIIGLIIFFCLRSRKRKRIAASQPVAAGHAPPAYQPPPMQQQTAYQSQQQTAYQPVPQKDNQFHGSPDYQPTQHGYFGGPTEPSKDSALSHVSPLGSPSPSHMTPRPFSAISSQHPDEQRPARVSPPLHGSVAQDYYKPPNSPTNTEVDGTQGNPGVPHGQQPGRMEVDGTQGNPGVPYDQHHYQGPYEMH